MKDIALDRLESIHDRLGGAGLVLGIIALVMALAGGAYAAAGGLSGKQRKEVSKIAKKEAQKYANSNPGAPGANGADGTRGERGDPGPPGKDGVNVTFSPASEAACSAGGAVFEAANGHTTICNGEEGDQGEPGPLISAYPPNTIVQGTWDVQPQTVVGSVALGTVSISYPFPVSTEIEPIQFLKVGESSTECPEPGEAQQGFLCVYEEFDSNSAIKGEPDNIHSAGGFTRFPFGARLVLTGDPGEIGAGTWTLMTP